MKCPQCTDVLVTLEFDRIEIDYCPRCEGIWLDAGELELLLGQEDGGGILSGQSPQVSRKEKKRFCPICSKGMNKILAGDGVPVLLDECPAHGLWLDRGELQKVLSAACSDTLGEARADALTRLLDEIFVPCSEESR